MSGGKPSSAFENSRSQIIEQLSAVENFFSSLMRHAKELEGPTESNEPSLGGQLLYIGELDETGCALATAANVAGSASLAATADSASQRKAVREGVADFLVNSLDEALRILKNEIRKREPVAVCISTSPDDVEREMLERGVQPDLLAEAAGFLRGGALNAPETCIVRAEPVATEQAWLAWGVTDTPAKWMPKLDALAMGCLAAEEIEAMRWLRHTPRYLSRDARGMRVVRCIPHTGRAIVARMEEEVTRGTIDTAVWISLRTGEELVEREWKPRTALDRKA